MGVLVFVPLGNWVASQLNIDIIKFSIPMLIMSIAEAVLSVISGAVLYKYALKSIFIGKDKDTTNKKSDDLNKEHLDEPKK
jgi:hypothetical protein